MKLLLLFVLLLAPSAGFAGNEHPGGGDALVSQFKKIAKVLADEVADLQYVNGLENETLTLIQVKLPSAVLNTPVSSTDSKLVLPDGREVDAIHYSGSNARIQFNRERWRALEASLESRRLLVLHEYLGVIEIEKDHYRVSELLLAELLRAAATKKVGEIRTCADLISKLAQQHRYSKLVLLSDIDCEQSQMASMPPEGYIPADLDVELDGRGHAIRNLLVGSAPGTVFFTLNMIAAPFQVIRKPIRNVRFENIKVFGQFGAAGLAESNYSSIESIYLEGRISSQWSGGLVITNYGTISSATVNVTMPIAYSLEMPATRGAFKGGIAGSNRGLINKSTVFGELSGLGLVGGLVGENSGTILSSVSRASKVVGWTLGGGLVARNTKAGRILGGLAAAKTVTGGLVGGLAGRNEGLIKDLKVSGNICGMGRLHGIVGDSVPGSSAVNVKSTATVTQTCKNP